MLLSNQPGDQIDWELLASLFRGMNESDLQVAGSLYDETLALDEVRAAILADIARLRERWERGEKPLALDPVEDARIGKVLRAWPGLRVAGGTVV